jgi:hypothetical protein
VNVNDRDKDSITKDEVQEAYDQYKDELNARLAKIFVAAHKSDEWFKERYMPGEKEIAKAKVVEFRKELWHKWKALLDAGSFDDVDRETQAHQGIKPENGTEDIVEEINRGVDDGGLRPVLLIKTISPTVSRVQLEEVSSILLLLPTLSQLAANHLYSLPQTISRTFILSPSRILTL